MTNKFLLNLLGFNPDLTSRQPRVDSLSLVSRQSDLLTYLGRIAAILLLVLTIGSGNAWGTVTIETTVGTYASAHSWSNETAYSSISMDSYATATAGGTGNNGKYYTSNSSWRFYESGTGSVTITVPTHYYLKQVSITFSKGNNGTIKLNGSSSVASGTLYSVTGTSAAFNSIGHSSGSNKGNIQITKIKAVYYVPTVLTLDKNGGDSDGSANIGYNDGTYTSFTAATRAGYTCKGYYTATSAGTKVLNADGTRASSSVSGWWTSSKWSKDAAEATLYAQWEAAASVAVTGVTVAPTSKSIVPGETFTITPTVAPANATDKVVSWTSSPTSKATVSSAGVVTGVAAGSSTITCTTHDGSYTATCAVTVRSVTLQALDEDGNAIGVGGPGAPTRSGTTITAAANSGNYVFKQWQITNATAASTTTSPTTLSNPTGNVTVTAVYYKPITITYKANGSNFTTQTYARGGTLAFPASNPDGATYSCTGKTFVGWVGEANKDYSSASTPPTYATAGGSVTAAATYYAVFADASGSGNYEQVTSLAGIKEGSAYFAYYGSYSGTRWYGVNAVNTVIAPVDVTTGVLTTSKTGDGAYTLQEFTLVAVDASEYEYYIKIGNKYVTASGNKTDLSLGDDAYLWKFNSINSTTYDLEILHDDATDYYIKVGVGDASSGKFRSYTSSGQQVSLFQSSTTYSNYATSCCTPLGSINGSFSLSSTGTSVTASVTTAGVSAYGDADNVSGYEFKLYTASAGGDAAASYSTNSKAGTSHEFTGLDPLTDYWVTVRPIGDGSTYCNTTAESSRVQITTLCVAPNHVDVSGRWDRFGGETISLTATAYSSAGTGSPIDDANITEWKWQKLVSTTWTDVSNGTTDGVTTSGAATKNLQISNCKLNNSGKYRCIISTGATCSTASATATDGTEGFDVKVYVLECYTGGTTVYNFTRVGDTQAGTAQITLAAGSHTFKFHADNIYYGNDGTINEDVTNWVCSTSQGNLTIAAGLGGTFTISMEYSTSGSSSVEGEPEISVTYPRKTIYLTPGVWNTGGAKFAFYYFRKVGETIYGEGFTDFITADDCGSSAEIPLWNGVKINAVRLNSNTIASDLTNSANHYKAAWDKKWNQTGDITITSNNSISITDWGTTDSPYEYGTYAVPTYTISYVKGSTTYTGGNTISGSKDSETKTCGVDFTLPSSAVFSATGYTQTGWTTSDGGSKTHNLGGDYTTNAAQAFYPAWTANTHSLSWSANGGDALTGDYTSGTVAYGTAITAPNTPTWTGHTFNGWHNGSSIVTPATTMLDNDLSYTAQWSLASYDVTLNVNGGTINAGNVTSYTYGTGATLPTNVTRDGYRFDGWFSDDGVWSDQVTAISTTATGDKTYYAKWTAIYTVTWHVNGSVYNTGVVSGNSQVISGGKISACPTAPADNTLSSCADKFMGWSAKNGGSDAKTTSYYDDLFTDVAGSPTINANKDFYAVFAEVPDEKYWSMGTITTIEDGATMSYANCDGAHTVTGSDGNDYTYTSSNVMNSSGNQFRGSSYCGRIYNTTTLGRITKIELVAGSYVSEMKVYESASSITASPGSGAITPSVDGSKYTYEFTGKGFFLIIQEGSHAAKANVTVYFGDAPSNYRTQCDANMVKVTYDANGGSTTCAGGSHDKRNDYTVCSSAPTKDYYSFAGWLCSADDEVYAASATIDDAVIDADFSLTAQWTPVTYNITYNLHGGTTAGGNPTTYDVETATIDLADGTYGHNRFEGWYSTYNDGTGAYSDQVTSIPLGSHGDITLHAKWTTRHEIIFDADGATTTIYRADDEDLSASVADQGSVPSDPSAPTACSSKVFVGWSESTIDGETDTEPGDLMKPAAGTVDEDKHYYAVWATATPASIPATYAGTGLFKQITRMSQLETGTYYVLRGVNGSTKKAMGNTVSSGKMGCVTDPVSEGVITNPGVAIVWKLGGTKDAYTLYNQDASKYVEITSNSTGGYELKTDASTSYTVTVEDDHGFFFKSNHASANLRGISIYNASEFRSYILSDAKTLELYKMPKTIYTAYSTSCCATKIVLSDPSITDASSSGSTITFDKSSPVYTCGGTKTVTATLTLTAGYQASALSFAVNSGTVSISPAISTPITSSQVYTLTFAKDQNATLTTTATIAAKPLNGITITPSSGEVYVGQYVDFTVSYDPADYINPGYTLNATPVYVTKESAAPANTKLRLKGGRGSGPGASITETVNETVTIKASGDNTKTASVNMTVNPLPRVHFEDLVHGKEFADVVATIVENALNPNKTTKTSVDWVTPNANDCEENHLHLVGWIREDWPALVAYLNGTGDAPTTTAIVGAGNDGAGHAYYIAAGASINVQTFNGVTFYAVWAEIK